MWAGKYTMQKRIPAAQQHRSKVINLDESFHCSLSFEKRICVDLPSRNDIAYNKVF